MGQFYGEISVIFFLSFRLKTAFSLRAFGVFVSPRKREREKNVYYFREEQTLFFEEVSSAFLSRPRRRRFAFVSFVSHKQRLAF